MDTLPSTPVTNATSGGFVIEMAMRLLVFTTLLALQIFKKYIVNNL